MNIRKAKIQDTESIRTLIIKSVDPENNSDFDEQGVRLFYKPNELPAIQSRVKDPDYLTLCYVRDDRIVGIITMYQNEKLYQLFVDPDYTKMGIATKLWNAAKELCLKIGNDNRFWVKSSTIAIPVYQSFGFKLTDGRQVQNGITYYPMVLDCRPV